MFMLLAVLGVIFTVLFGTLPGAVYFGAVMFYDYRFGPIAILLLFLNACYVMLSSD